MARSLGVPPDYSLSRPSYDSDSSNIVKSSIIPLVSHSDSHDRSSPTSASDESNSTTISDRAFAINND